MAENKMLIDATHPEETRVVVLRNGRVEEFDYESAARKLLRGSIFLAKITRVEPSLQAVFVDYGGNRHGFLAFNEIHPDYYQIPHSDRQALLDEEAANRYDFGDDDDADDVAEAQASDEQPTLIDDNDAEDDSDVENEPVEASFSANDNDGDGDDADDFADPAIEAAAIDVTEYLPPEEPVEPAVAETEGAAAEPEATLTTDTDLAEMPETVSMAEAESPDVNVAAAIDEDDKHDDNDDKPQKPTTIAAAITPDERIVSEVVEPSTGSDTNDDATTVEPAPAENATDFETKDSEEIAALPTNTAIEDDQVEPDNGTPANNTEATTSDDLDDNPNTDNDPDTESVAHSREAARSRETDREDTPDEADDSSDDEGDDSEQIDNVGEDTDVLGEVPVRRRRRARSYKIQEVIKRRQVVLVQVVKEERGNKGAALTTYMSLAGRYTVLMPNTARGGGISRKITNLQDRKRLKAIAQELDVPEGMGLIIRTAGAARTKQEIKRDFEYLLRLWENVRDLTLQSTAPSLVYEEGDLIKRSIRDLYSKDIEQVVVAGDASHKEAKSFMRMLMPSHVKNVIKYDEPQPLFARYRIEQQLNAMFSPFVQLKSGGYLVINQTEALVAVDVNSGKSTRKFSIEDTALNTNIEAAEELSRQLKLRDLAGLIVIDFIDMEEKRNNRAVERRLKECLRDDRARIQVGRISHFGLLEMSRQRLRTGVLEGSTMPCQHCQGTGIIRSTESVALALLRTLEDNLMGSAPRSMTAHCSREVAMYLLNHKRHFVLEMEARYGISIHINASDEQQGADFLIERMNGAPPTAPRRIERSVVNVDSGFSDGEEESEETRQNPRDENTRDDSERRPKRRRRRRGRRTEGEGENNGDEQLESRSASANDAEEDSGQEPEAREDGDGEGEERNARRRRRGRRGGRRNRSERSAADGVATPGAPQPEISAPSENWNADETATATQTDNQSAQAEIEADIKSGADTSGPANIEAYTDVVAASAQFESTPAGSIPTENASVSATDDAQQPSGGSSHDVENSHVDAVEAVPATTPEPEPETAAAEPSAIVDDAEPQPDTSADGTNSADDNLSAEEAQTSSAAETEASEPVEQDEKSTGAPRGEPVSSAPVLERVTMTPETEAADGEETPKVPTRKGWWQRRFGS